MMDDTDYETDTGLSSLLEDRIEENRQFVRAKTELVNSLHATDQEYEAALRQCFEYKKYVRSCEAAVAVQLHADTPMRLEDHSQVDDDIARIAEHFSPEPSRFLQRLNGSN